MCRQCQTRMAWHSASAECFVPVSVILSYLLTHCTLPWASLAMRATACGHVSKVHRPFEHAFRPQQRMWPLIKQDVPTYSATRPFASKRVASTSPPHKIISQ